MPLPSFFSRVGGKSRLKRQIVSLIPEHTTYVEPFVGGGSVFLAKPPSEREVINDLDMDIADLYADLRQVSQSEVDAMTFRLDPDGFAQMLNVRFTSPAGRLYRNLYLSTASFSGNRKDFAMSAAARGFNACKLKRRLPDYQARLAGVEVLNQDYKTVLRKYDAADTFFYLDPPYSQNGASWGYIGRHFTPADLAEVLRGLKGKWLVSYDDSAEVREAFGDWTIERIDTSYTMNKSVHRSGKRVGEVLIRNY